MSDIAIRVDNLGKRCRISGSPGAGGGMAFLWGGMHIGRRKVQI